MTSPRIWLGNQALKTSGGRTDGHYVDIEGERFYRIRHFDQMDDFFISLVSFANHWLFISTSGGLTAGRSNSESALFPYYTEDKIRDGAGHTGHRAVFLVGRDATTYYWEPFARHFDGAYELERNLYKDVIGSTLIFEEINHDLGIAYRYAWQTSHAFGFVKRSWLTHCGTERLSVRLLDGIENVLPYGATPHTQNELSCLLDAYKKNELEPASGVALYTMSSLLTDRAEPSEALSATTVWSYGLAAPQYLLSSLQLSEFRRGGSVVQEHDVHGRRGAYFVVDEFELDVGEARHWGIVAEVNQGSAAVADLIHCVASDQYNGAAVEQDIAEGQRKLRAIVGTADGFQVTAEELSTAHHTANVLFNVMRGGLFDENYVVAKDDFLQFCADWNRPASEEIRTRIAELPARVDYLTLKDAIEATNEPVLMRLFLEYLPLSFSRRHGDPSRPWNQFSIDVLTEDNQKRLAYAGNWRDIFQNWEALSTSIPGFIDNIICKFLSASTADGYNPYRITREGIDWEKPEPENPWANIGYWGDHQIIYLLKLLELSEAHFPASLDALLGRDVFAYANVPYRVKGFEELIKNPLDTICFDDELDEAISRQVDKVGADGRLMWVDGAVYQVNLLEKLLVTVLSKLTNFIPGGGIWMNTQRPEWNDANNALVGTGVSMVTLCYLHRCLRGLDQILAQSDVEHLPISAEVLALFDQIAGLFARYTTALRDDVCSDVRRYEVLEQLGRAGEAYRSHIYERGFSGQRETLAISKVRELFADCLPVLERSIRENQREDGLFHAYNRVRIASGEASLIRLDEMLEGQVAVLSAKVLSADESLQVLTALRQSALYTARQNTYLLYPEKTLARFAEKNQLPADVMEEMPLIARLLDSGNTEIIESDASGGLYFSGALTKREDIESALADLSGRGMVCSPEEREQLAQLFVDTFAHDLFTGRSGGMYAYEGIGSIYWHMVSKLLLAVSEVVVDAHREEASSQTLEALTAIYEDVRGGIGFNKSPDEYGAFPTDPYSHTPGFAGAKQPGMTGQVKEEVLTRLIELGVTVRGGVIAFESPLLRVREFLDAPATLDYFDVAGKPQTVALDAGQMGFTFCQVPVVLQQGDVASIVVRDNTGADNAVSGSALSEAISHSIFMKRGQVSQLTVTVAR